MSTINQFNKINCIKNQHYLILGRRSSGKTTASINIAKLIYETKMVNDCIIFSSDTKYVTELGINKVFDTIDYDKLSQIVKERNNNDNNSHLLLIFDNIFDELSLKTDIIQMILLNGRHMNISLIVTMSYPYGLNPSMCASFDYVFMAYDSDDKYIHNLNDKFGGFKMNTDFEKIFKEITSQYDKTTLMVLNKCSNKPIDVLCF